VCACFRAGASTLQVLARYDSIRARHDSADAYFFSTRACYDTARARLYSVRASLHSVRTRLYSARARFYSARARLHSVHTCQSTSRFRPRLPQKRPRPSNIRKCTRKYRPSPWHSVRARGFLFAPDDVTSAHSSIPSAPALMRLCPRVRARQLPHAPEGL
jgi:hypothetical protein